MIEFRSFGRHSRENGNPESKMNTSGFLPCFAEASFRRNDELRETAASRDRESTEGRFDTIRGP
jgi:hypothetical protein